MTNKRLIIQVRQRGGCYAMGKADHHAKLERHARSIIAELCSVRLANTLRIEIHLSKRVSMKHALGVCHPRDMSRGKTARAKHYKIEILSTRSLRDQLDILTHELMHVVQFAQGRMDWSNGVTKWRPIGHTGPSMFYKDGELEWRDQPWEIEAMEAQKRYRSMVTRSMMTERQVAAMDARKERWRRAKTAR